MSLTRLQVLELGPLDEVDDELRTRMVAWARESAGYAFIHES